MRTVHQVVSWQGFESSRVTRNPTADEADYIEVEGAVDWAIEVLSPSSVKKDTDTLFRLYHQAEVREYWIVDARGPRIRFTPYAWQPDGFVPMEAKGGWYSSSVFNHSFRWQRKKNRLNEWTHVLEHR